MPAPGGAAHRRRRRRHRLQKRRPRLRNPGVEGGAEVAQVHVPPQGGALPLSQSLVHLSRLDRRVATSPCSTAQLFRQLVVRGGTWFVWVKVVGGAREAAGWTCDVHVGDICARGLKMHPVNRTVKKVLETGQYLPSNTTSPTPSPTELATCQVPPQRGGGRREGGGR